jgi:hypothetical protein
MTSSNQEVFDQDSTEMTYYDQLSKSMNQAGPGEIVTYKFKDRELSEIVVGMSAAEANIIIAALEYAANQVADSEIAVFDESDRESNMSEAAYAANLALKLRDAVSRT